MGKKKETGFFFCHRTSWEHINTQEVRVTRVEHQGGGGRQERGGGSVGNKGGTSVYCHSKFSWEVLNGFSGEQTRGTPTTHRYEGNPKNEKKSLRMTFNCLNLDK